MPAFVYLIRAHTIINFVEMSTGANVPASVFGRATRAIYRVSWKRNESATQADDERREEVARGRETAQQ